MARIQGRTARSIDRSRRNAAIEIAQKEEMDLVERLFGPDQMASQDRLVKALQSHGPDVTNEDAAQGTLLISPFVEFVYNGTSNCLAKFATTCLLHNEV